MFLWLYFSYIIIPFGSRYKMILFCFLCEGSRSSEWHYCIESQNSYIIMYINGSIKTWCQWYIQ